MQRGLGPALALLRQEATEARHLLKLGESLQQYLEEHALDNRELHGIFGTSRIRISTRRTLTTIGMLTSLSVRRAASVLLTEPEWHAAGVMVSKGWEQ